MLTFPEFVKRLTMRRWAGARGAGATGAAVPVAQIVRGQHGGKRLPFLQELHLKHAC